MKKDKYITKKKTETIYVIEFKRYSRPDDKPVKRTYMSYKEAAKDWKTLKSNGATFNKKFYKTEKTYYK